MSPFLKSNFEFISSGTLGDWSIVLPSRDMDGYKESSEPVLRAPALMGVVAICHSCKSFCIPSVCISNVLARQYGLICSSLF